MKQYRFWNFVWSKKWMPYVETPSDCLRPCISEKNLNQILMNVSDEVLLKFVERAVVLRKSAQWRSALLKDITEILPFFPYFLTSFKFRMDLHILPSGSFELHENWCSERHMLLKSITEILFIFSTFFSQLGNNFLQKIFTNVYCLLVSYVTVSTGMNMFFMDINKVTFLHVVWNCMTFWN